MSTGLHRTQLPSGDWMLERRRAPMGRRTRNSEDGTVGEILPSERGEVKAVLWRATKRAPWTVRRERRARNRRARASRKANRG